MKRIRFGLISCCIAGAAIAAPALSLSPPVTAAPALSLSPPVTAAPALSLSQVATEPVIDTPQPPVPTRAVWGRVTFPDGKPVKGATVRCVWVDCIPETFGPVLSDGQGRYAIGGVSRAGVEVIAEAGGREPAVANLPAGEDNATVNLQMKPGHFMEGRTVDQAGKPVAGVSVRLDDEYREPVNRQAVTDRQGRFRLADLPAKEIHLEMQREDYCGVNRLIARVDDRTDHVFVLQPARYVSGIVTDARTGKPVKEFRVDGQTGPDFQIEHYKTADGRFRYRSVIHSPTGHYYGWNTDDKTEITITVGAEGYMEKTIEHAPVRPVSAKSLLRVRLEPLRSPDKRPSVKVIR